MKGQKVKPSQDGTIGNAKKSTKNQSQKQPIEELRSGISEKDLATAKKDHIIAQNTQAIAEKDEEICKLNISATKGQGVKRTQRAWVILTQNNWHVKNSFRIHF